jgi:hypothetical protein
MSPLRALLNSARASFPIVKVPPGAAVMNDISSVPSVKSVVKFLLLRIHHPIHPVFPFMSSKFASVSFCQTHNIRPAPLRSKSTFSQDQKLREMTAIPE